MLTSHILPPKSTIIESFAAVYVKAEWMEVIDVTFKEAPVYMSFEWFRFFKTGQIKNNDKHL